ncbi:MAG: phenylalanine--tRNA ligase subunit alpha [Bacteroidetes bacterium]|nr:phenylalanine--tRNA ligase subunit alpha [Bacteroidota bacterium]
MFEQISAIKESLQAQKIKNRAELEQFRLTFLSKKGKISELMPLIGKAASEEKRIVGQLINDVKQLAQGIFESAQTEFENSGPIIKKATDDLTLTALPYNQGGLHPLSNVLEEIKAVFFRLGFSIADGPELEDDFHNFTALNFPPEHPARDMQDTFFVRKDEKNKSDLVMRTHTSPVQVRLMQSQKPPIRSIMPGRVYRNESITAKSYCLFNQVEGLYIDKNVTMAELKETLIVLAKMMYGADVRYRLRPSFFPFTEPSMEMDVWWERKDGSRWLEILGAGMVDPNVLTACGLNPDEFTGFALGLGVDRMAMLRYGLNDIRDLYENDIRLISQFA